MTLSLANQHMVCVVRVSQIFHCLQIVLLCARAYWGGHSTRAPKSPNNIASTFFNTVHLLPKGLRLEHGDGKLVSCPGRHLTSACPWLCVHKKTPNDNDHFVALYASAGQRRVGTGTSTSLAQERWDRSDSRERIQLDQNFWTLQKRSQLDRSAFDSAHNVWRKRHVGFAVAIAEVQRVVAALPPVVAFLLNSRLPYFHRAGNVHGFRYPGGIAAQSV